MKACEAPGRPPQAQFLAQTTSHISMTDSSIGMRLQPPDLVSRSNSIGFGEGLTGHRGESGKQDNPTHQGRRGQFRPKVGGSIDLRRVPPGKVL